MNIQGLLGLVTIPKWRERLGDVATPMKVVNSLVDHLEADPVELLLAGETLVDPCCGHGTILIEIARRAKGKVDAQKIAKQLHGYDITHAITAKKLLANELGVDVGLINIYQENSLGIDMNIENFRVIMNPPFNEEPGEDRNNAGNSNNSTLYQQFVNKFSGTAKQVVSLNPAGWTIKSKDVEQYKKMGLKNVQFLPASYFPSVNIRSGLTISNFVRGYKGDITVTTVNNETYVQARTDKIKNITPTAKTILEKVSVHPNLGQIISNGTVLLPRGTKGQASRAIQISPDLFQLEKSEDFPYKMVAFIGGGHRDMSWLYCSRPCNYLDKHKIAISCATSKYLLGNVVVLEPGVGVSKNNLLIKTQNRKESEMFKAFLDSKIVKFIVRNNKFNDVVNTKTNTWNHIPQPPIDKMLEQQSKFDVDMFLYREYNITHEEQKYIEENLK
jgi:hypothetical protein